MRKFYNLSLLVLILVVANNAWATQGPALTITSQADIVAFATAPYDTINGDLVIQDNNDGLDPIVDLDPLFEIDYVDRDVFVFDCDSLTTLTGLDVIKFVGRDFIIRDNENLLNWGIYGYELNTVWRDTRIVDNPNLTTTNGSNLTSIERIFIDNNPSLTGLNFFNNLTSIAVNTSFSYISIGDCPSLSDFSAFDSLTTCEGPIDIRNCGATTFDGFNSLENFSNLVRFYYHTNLETISGFNLLTRAHIDIASNNNLTTIDGFNALQIIPDDFIIRDNPSLTNINGFSSIDSIYDDLNVRDNALLSDCSVFECVFPKVLGNISISNNLAGCNSIEEISSAPALFNCPASDTAFVGENCLADFILIDPTFSDNCGITSAKGHFIIYESDGSTFSNSFDINPGQPFTYENYDAGDRYEIIWEVINLNNDTTTCETKITIADNTPPTFTNSLIANSQFECVETFDSVRQVSEAMLTISDNCSNDVTYVYHPELTDTILDFYPVIDYDLYYSAIDVYGNQSAPSQEIKIVHYAAELTATATGGELDCSGNAITINGNASSNHGNVIYSWTGPNGFTSNQQNPSVSQAGDYILTVSVGNDCSDMATATVTTNTDVPNLSTSGITTLDCNNTSVTLTASSTTSNVTYVWEGPNGVVSNTENVTLSQGNEGDYTVTATAANGCTNASIITVNDNYTVPTVTGTNGGLLTCDSPTYTFDVAIVESDVSYSWTGPNGFTSTELNPTVDKAGIYAITVILNANGCPKFVGFDVFENFDEPVASASVIGSINCQTTSAQLQASSSLASTYAWTGPNGFTSTLQNPIVTQGGDYTVTATAVISGCTDQAMVTVDQNGDLPDVSTAGGNIDCNNTSVTISASSNTAGVTYAWTGPNNFMSSEAAPTVDEAGTYNVTVTSTNGCSAQGVTVVNEDLSAPTTSGTSPIILTCTATSITLDLTTTPSTGVTYAWTGPNGFTSTEQQPSVTASGQYTVTTTLTATGCTTLANFQVNSNTTEPNLTANGGEIDCNNSSVTLTANSTTSGITYNWSGPNGYTSTEQNPTVNTAGDYTVTATAENGCTSYETVSVTASGDLPDATLDVNAVDCSNNEVTIDVTANGSYTYEWTLNGNSISSTASLTISEAGTYNLAVSATNGCVTNLSYTLEENIQDLLADVTTTEATNGNDGTATIDVTNTNLATSILWDNGQTNETATGLSVGAHTVTVTSAYGCSFTYNFNIDMATPVIDDEVILNSLTIYPSPFTSEVNLSATLKSTGEVSLLVFDNIGKVGFERNLGTTNNIQELLDLSELKNGMYHISIIIDGEMFTEQIIKM